MKTVSKNIMLVVGSLFVVFAASFSACNHTASKAVSQKSNATPKLFVDVHELEPGKVSFDAVMGAHQKDLATQDKYGVKFLKFWVDEGKGKVYCLSEAQNAQAIYNTHKEAHGLVPNATYEVTDGMATAALGNENLFFDVHYLGKGNVNAKAVAEAHQKDLAVEGKYGVNFINYWIDEQKGVVMCLAEAKTAEDMIRTHKEAHGLVPDEVHQVKQGQ